MEKRNVENKEQKRKQNYLTHSLTGNTCGNNNTETVINILNQTTVKPISQSVKLNEIQSKKEGK